jgi:hypothetical protein
MHLVLGTILVALAVTVAVIPILVMSAKEPGWKPRRSMWVTAWTNGSTASGTGVAGHRSSSDPVMADVARGSEGYIGS